MTKIDVLPVGMESQHLQQVMALHAKRKSRLGPFPEGAFEDHALKRQILVAVTSDNVVAGYLLYRIAQSERRATIVHLTSAEEFRGQGLARLLVDHLKITTRHLAGISLKCRRDYDLGGMWGSLGFTVRNSAPGRSADGSLLDLWWFDHGHEDLFSSVPVPETKIMVVMDANVFFDLTCPGRPQGEDTKVLQADWLKDSIELCVTLEIYNEIHRAADEDGKRESRAAAQAFRQIRTDESVVRDLEEKLKPWFKGAILDRDISDLRQIAHAIAAEVPFFLTRDRKVLDRAEDLFNAYGLNVLDPTSLVNRLDQLRREAEYRPVRLEGSRWRERLVMTEDMEVIGEAFRHPQKERVRDFERRFRHFLTQPEKWRCRLVSYERGLPSMLVVQSNIRHPHVRIPILRHADHPLAGTLLRHLLHALSHDTEGCVKTIGIEDTMLSATAITALQELGFVTDGSTWWKLSLTGLVTQEQLSPLVRAAELPAGIKDALLRPELIKQQPHTPEAVIQIERTLSPVKLVASQLPCFVVSIRPDWAAHFFDIPVGGQVLMDLKEKLHLGIEGVYYCSASNSFVSAPSRILWYVSKGQQGGGSMSIKACSAMVETAVAKPKELFSRFRNLGVYAWKDVLNAAGSLDDDVMAFRFARTERFVREIPLQMMRELGIPQPINPRRISNEQFAAVYRIGMNL